MSEERNKNETGSEDVPTLGDKERVGDILRKERLTRRITAETIAKDLKLNVGYIKALEASDLASLPPEPYVRVYIKSLSQYLSLDTEQMLREFDKERGLISDDYDKNANKIDIRMGQKHKSPSFVLIAALLVLAVVFIYVGNRQGWFEHESATPGNELSPDTLNEIDLDSITKAKEDSTAAAVDSARQAQEKAAETKTPPPPPAPPPRPRRQVVAPQPEATPAAPTTPAQGAGETTTPARRPLKQAPAAAPAPSTDNTGGETKAAPTPTNNTGGETKAPTPARRRSPPAPPAATE